MDKIKTKEFKNIAKDVRRYIVKMHAKADSSHIASALSCVDILVVLYFGIMRFDKIRDKFILSKGHAVSALYAILSKKCFFSEQVLDKYCINNTNLPGHCTRESISGVEASTGSLGHGLSIGTGMALARNYDKLKEKIFVLLSDGECDEGSTWEAAMFASHHKLDNLIAIIDYNKLQAFGRTEEVLNLEPFKDKWIAFGWSVKEVDGHDFKELIKVLKGVPFNKNKPSAIIAHTVKGKGISFMENKLEWHYRSPNSEQLEAALKELD